MGLNTNKPVYKLRSKRTNGGAPPAKYKNSPAAPPVTTPLGAAENSGYGQTVNTSGSGSQKKDPGTSIVVNHASASTLSTQQILLYSAVGLVVIILIFKLFKK